MASLHSQDTIPGICRFPVQRKIPNQQELPIPIKSKILIGALAGSASEAQTKISGLEQCTKLNIKQEMSNLLQNGVNFPFNESIPESFDQFSLEEDLQLLLYIRLYEHVPLSEYVQDTIAFKPFRSLESISERLKEVQNMEQSRKEEIISQMAKQIAIEKVNFELSQSKNQTGIDDHLGCIYSPQLFTSSLPLSPATDSEIHKLETNLHVLQSQFKANELAILRCEHYSYSMCQQTILIGRGTNDHEVDVDLTYEDDHNCTHTSRYQAVISFRGDCRFYLENCGHSIIRVNGTILYPTGICIIEDNTLLDFSNILALFLINNELVNTLKTEFFDED